MGTKRCSYKGCNEFSIKGCPSQITLYQFPKDVERYKKWMILSQCDQSIPKHLRFICAKHFDSSKYISSNQRRSVLIGTAVPFPYNANTSDTSSNNDQSVIDDDEFQQCVESTIEEDDDRSLYTDEHEDMSQLSIVETLTQYEESNVSNTAIDRDGVISSTDAPRPIRKVDINLKRRHYNQEEMKNNTIKIKRFESIHLSSPSERFVTAKYHGNSSKANQLQVTKVAELKSPQQPSQDIKVTKKHELVSKVVDEDEYEDKIDEYEDKIDEITLFESKHINTFIYKGEEYIQLPKKDYIQEKLSLIQKIKSYELILTSIKNSVDNFEIS